MNKGHNKYNVLWINNSSGRTAPIVAEFSRLSDSDLNLITVDDLEKGIAHLKKNKGDCILLDFCATEKENLRNLGRLYEKFPDIAVIAMFDKEDLPQVKAAIAQGAQDYAVNGRDLARALPVVIERKKFEQKLQEKLSTVGEQAKLATKAKTEFLAKMSHEIRNPLGAMLGFSSVLKRSKLTPRQKEQLETIISCGNLLLGITNDMLDISKIETGQIKLEVTDFDLRQLIEDVVKISKTRIGTKEITVYFEIENGVPVKLHGDPNRLRQILINLLNNAIKFTRAGEVSLTVGLIKGETLKKDQVSLRFTVRDTGAGVPEDKKEVIFELFEQADYSKTREQGGAGLGLTISRAFVEAMGGKIWVESKVGQGSDFIFTAKFKETALKISDKGKTTTDMFAETITHRNITEKLDCKGIKVLVAEDGIPSQDLIKAYFEYLGCEADYVVNGKEAIERIKENHYDICLMDVGMPVIDGVEATKIIRKKIDKDLPIIALTAAALKRDRDLCLEAGMDDYIKKPVDVMKLKEKILLYTKSKSALKRK